MNHHFRGAKLAYRFDFSSSCLLPEAHMSVEPGIFATFEMAPLEVLASRVGSIPLGYTATLLFTLTYALERFATALLGEHCSHLSTPSRQ